VIGGYDPAADPVTAKYAASGHLRALQAERRALARRISARLVTFSQAGHAHRGRAYRSNQADMCPSHTRRVTGTCPPAASVIPRS
jgi:hypothetical protein